MLQHSWIGVSKAEIHQQSLQVCNFVYLDPTGYMFLEGVLVRGHSWVEDNPFKGAGFNDKKTHLEFRSCSESLNRIHKLWCKNSNMKALSITLWRSIIWFCHLNDGIN